MKRSRTLAIRMTLESLARITLVGLRLALSPQSGGMLFLTSFATFLSQVAEF